MIYKRTYISPDGTTFNQIAHDLIEKWDAFSIFIPRGKLQFRPLSLQARSRHRIETNGNNKLNSAISLDIEKPQDEEMTSKYVRSLEE